MDASLINWPAVLVAALSSFIVGGIWYNPKVFGNTWMKESNLKEEELRASSQARIFGFTGLFSLIMATNLACFLAEPATDTSWGAQSGFLAGIWGFSAIAIHSLFELRSWKHIFINGFYIVIALTLMGAILGAWR